MLGTRLTCTIRGSSISGNIGGKAVHCGIRLSKGGTSLPAGEYQILPPQDDLIYGTIALVVPAGKWEAPGGRVAVLAQVDCSGRGGGARGFTIEAPGKGAVATVTRPGIASMGSPTGGGGSGRGAEAAGGTQMEYVRRLHRVAMGICFGGGGGGAGKVSFVLSGRPILGGNHIVVRSGFADLMDALKASGGATLVVS